MPNITDWILVLITFVYAVTTILICVFNAKSAKATRDQVVESMRQFEESKRLETIPLLQMETYDGPEQLLFEIKLELSQDNIIQRKCRSVKIKNLGNGTATNIIYIWGTNTQDCICDYPPINAIMRGDGYCFQLTYCTDKSIEETSSVLIWQYDDILGNSYEQRVFLIFNHGVLIRCENDIPSYKGACRYYLPEKQSSIRTSDE